MLKTGTTGCYTTMVTEDNTAKSMKSGDLPVFATPALAAAMEAASVECIGDVLEPGMTTVGTKLNLSHTAATPIGIAIRAEAELVAVDGRKLIFKAVAYDNTGIIGTAEHERFIVEADRFLTKANEKRNDHVK